MSTIQQAVARVDSALLGSMAAVDSVGTAARRLRVSPLPALIAGAATGVGADTSTFRPVRVWSTSNRVVLDLALMQRHGYLQSSQARTVLSEEFRRIKRPLLANARLGDDGLRQSLMMVTSAMPSEGKTFCAINLAMSLIAEIDTSVLLVDADVMRPSLADRLGFIAQRGLLDLLTDPSLTLADVVVSTNVPKLELLTSGTPNDQANELLASQSMDDLLQRLAQRAEYQVVVFDAPPLLVTNEANALASRVGQVVLVVEAGKTPKSAVVDALKRLSDCPTVSLILNKASEPSFQGYGYGYD